MRESVESPRFGHGSRNSSLTKRSSMMPPKDYNDELEMAYTAANIKKIFDKRKRYFSFNQSSNHSIDDSSDRSGLVHENYKQSMGGAGKTPSFAPGFTMKMKKGKDFGNLRNDWVNYVGGIKTGVKTILFQPLNLQNYTVLN